MDSTYYFHILRAAYVNGALGATPGLYAVDLAFRQQMTYARVNQTTAELEAAKKEFVEWLRENG